MKIVFKRIKEDGEFKTIPLFPWNQSAYNNVSLETVIDNFNKVADENTFIFSLYAGNYEFREISKSNIDNIEILVKFHEDKAIEILKVDKKYSNLDEMAELLNKEVKDEDIKYEVFRVKGELK